jgi:hypothetical protein
MECHRVIVQTGQSSTSTLLEHPQLPIRRTSTSTRTTIDSIGGGFLEIEPDELRRHYTELSDEGILDIKREDLTDLAKQYYDAEIRNRGLALEPPGPDSEASSDEELVVVETFPSLNEAEVGRAALRSAGIPAFLDNELAAAWTGPRRSLLVPSSYLADAKAILETPLWDDELAAQAEAAEPVDRLVTEEPDDSMQEGSDR